MQLVANGCGSRITIDYALKLKGLNDLIICCNIHDDCYDTCGATRLFCDDYFAACMNSVCNKIPINTLKGDVCRIDVKTMDALVRAFGLVPYAVSQFKQCLKSKAVDMSGNFFSIVLLYHLFFVLIS